MAMKKKDKAEAFRLLGIDPGTNVCGYAVIEVRGSQLNMIKAGTFNFAKIDDPYEKLRHIFLDVQEVIENHQPHSVAIEAPFYGKNVQSMLKLGRAQGVAIAAAITMGLDCTEYAPRKIKQSITGNGNSSKEQVAAMLESILRCPLQHISLDATDALAVAVCHHYQSSGPLAGKGKKYKDWSSFLSDNPQRRG
jgi:crossover junction endodeoxyribonuclease RuvC